MWVMSIPAVGDLRFVAVAQDDPLAAPLIDELAVEYADRYGGARDKIHAWLRGYPSAEFEAPGGGLLIGLLDGHPVTGGAFRRFDEATAELAVALTLAAARRLPQASASVADGTWGTWSPFEYCGAGMSGATVGVAGMGRIGATYARMMAGGLIQRCSKTVR